MPATTLYTRTGGGNTALGNAVIGRRAVPNTLPSVVVEAKAHPTTLHGGAVHPKRLNPRGVTTNAPRSIITGDPIHQLIRSGPAPKPLEHERQLRHPGKRGDMEGVGDLLPIQREGEVARKRRHQALQGQRRAQLAASGGKVALGVGKLSGFDIIKSPLVRPGLPAGRQDVSAATEAHNITETSYQQLTQPAGLSKSMPAPGTAAPVSATSRALLELAPVTVTLPPGVVTDASATTKPPGFGDDTTQGSAGRVIFMVAAVAVAFLILRR